MLGRNITLFFLTMLWFNFCSVRWKNEMDIPPETVEGCSAGV